MPRLGNSVDSQQSKPIRLPRMDFSSVTDLVSQNLLFEAIPALQERGFPMAYVILCVRFTWIVHSVAAAAADRYIRILNSASGATLDTGGRLDLTRQGLSPCKMHQA